jgi:hypothetical protein
LIVAAIRQVPHGEDGPTCKSVYLKCQNCSAQKLRPAKRNLVGSSRLRE